MSTLPLQHRVKITSFAHTASHVVELEETRGCLTTVANQPPDPKSQERTAAQGD